MYQKEFEKLLRSTPPRALLLYGENPYLIESYIQHYIHITQTRESLLRLYYEEYQFEQAKNHLAQSSLFGGANLLIIKRDKKIPPKELETLIALVDKQPENYLIFEYQGNAKEAKSLQRLFRPSQGGGAQWVRLFEPNMQEGIYYLQQRVKQDQIEIDRYALQHLLLLLNNDLSLALNELKKLAVLQRKITTKEIDQLVYSTAPLAVEELLIKLIEKKPMLNTLEHLIDQGIDLLSVVRSSQFFIQQLFLFHAYMKLHGRIDSKAILGYQLPKHIEQQKAQLALRIKGDKMMLLFEYLLNLELRIKKTPTPHKASLLYGGLIKLQSLL